MKTDSKYESKIAKLDRWDNRFMNLCDIISEWSEERGRKVGAIIVDESNTIVSTGYNGLPRGISSSPESRHSRENDEKYYWFEHAERNAIYNAARIGVSLLGCRMYSSLFPCADCTRAIIQAGLAELVTRTQPEAEIKFGRSMNVSVELLKEAQIKLRYI